MKFFQRLSSRFLTFLTSLWKYLYQYRKFAILWLGIVIFAVIGIALNLDNKAITFLVLIFGIISQAFIVLIGVINLIPVVGPILAKVLALPFFWILNSIGYFLSIIAIRRGYSKTVLDYRILTVVFLIGVAVGFIVGKLI
jgi:hypothetical protein